MKYQRYLKGEPVRVIGQSTTMDILSWDPEQDIYLCEFQVPDDFAVFGDYTKWEAFESNVLESVKFAEFYRHIFNLSIGQIELLKYLYNKYDSNRIALDKITLNDEQSSNLERLFERLTERNRPEFGKMKHGDFIKEFIEFDFLKSDMYILYKNRIRDNLWYYDVTID